MSRCLTRRIDASHEWSRWVGASQDWKGWVDASQNWSNLEDASQDWVDILHDWSNWLDASRIFAGSIKLSGCFQDVSSWVNASRIFQVGCIYQVGWMLPRMIELRRCFTRMIESEDACTPKHKVNDEENCYRLKFNFTYLLMMSSSFHTFWVDPLKVLKELFLFINRFKCFNWRVLISMKRKEDQYETPN